MTGFVSVLEGSLASWNVLIKCLSQRGQRHEALQAFYQMQVEGFIPCEASYVCVMSCFAGDMDPDHGKRMHSLIMHRSFHLNVIVSTALVSMYVRQGKVLDAISLFNNMPFRNVLTWTTMITAHGRMMPRECTLYCWHVVVKWMWSFVAVLFVCIVDVAA